jgi:hypothetical protein
MQVSRRLVGDKRETSGRQVNNQAAQSNQTVVGEHTRSGNLETESKSCGPGMQPFQRSKNPIQVNLFVEESGQRKKIESQGQGGKEKQK